MNFTSGIEFYWDINKKRDENFLPDEFSGIFCGELKFDLNLILDCEADRNGWIENVYPDYEDEYDRIYHNKLAFQRVDNGDLIAIELEPEHYGKVVYLSHDGSDNHGRYMGENFKEFLLNYTAIGCTGGEDWQWEDFCTEKGIDAQSDCAKKWREFLGGDITMKNNFETTKKISYEPYIMKISDEEVALFICKKNEQAKDFASKFFGFEYESEYERFSYLTGTDVFAEAVVENDQIYFVVKDWDDVEYFRVAMNDDILKTLILDEEGSGVSVIFSPEYISRNEAEEYFLEKHITDFGQIMTDMETKNKWEAFSVYGYIVCFFTEKDKENMRKDFGME